MTAPMAVKCSPQMATTNNTAAAIPRLSVFRSPAARKAAEAAQTPIAIDAATKVGDQTISAGRRMAATPVKCIRPIPPPQIAPPTRRERRLGPIRATLKPPPKPTIAASSDNAVSPIPKLTCISRWYASIAMKCVAQTPDPIMKALIVTQANRWPPSVVMARR
ncbi:MAG: hypothetical protein ABIO39_01010 [Caulobacteraceae bacterium]